MKYLIAAVALLATATPALAQDDAYDFTGPYVGAFVGLDHYRIKDKASGESGSREGAAFGALVGYNVDAGGLIFGIEGEWGDASTSADAGDVFVAGDNLKLSANRDLFIGARAGVAAGSRAMVYVKGGYTNTRMTLQYSEPGFSVVEGSDTIDGWRAGGGVEFAATDKVLIRGEYRYSDYAEYKYLTQPTGLEASRHQFIVGVVGKF